MGMRNYPSDGYLIDIETEGVAAKLGLEQEWNDFIQKAEDSGFELIDFTPRRDMDEDETPEVKKALRALDTFIEAFEKRYNCTPELLFLDEDTEGLDDHLEKEILYLSLDSSDLYLPRIETQGMLNLQAARVNPVYSRWCEYG